MSHPNGPQPPVPPQGRPPQGQPPHGQPPHGQPPQGPPPPPYGPPPGWGPPPQGPPAQGQPPQGPPAPPYGSPTQQQWSPQGPPAQQQWGPQGSGGYPQQPGYDAPQWTPTPPQGSNGGNRGRNIVLVVVGAVVALALIVAAVVVGISVLDDGSESSESGTSASGGSQESDGDQGGESGGGDGGGGGEPMTEAAVGDLAAALEANDTWSCYTTVTGSLVRCHSFVAGEDPQRATLRVSLADGAVTDVDLAAYLVDDPAAITEVAAKAVGDTLFDGKGGALVAAAASDTNLGPEELGAEATFTAYGDGFQIRVEGAEAVPAAGPSPAKTAALTPTLTSKGFTCEKDDAESVSCDKNDGRASVRILGIDHETASSWSVSVRGAAYDTPLDEKQARTLLGQEMVALGLTDEAGSSWMATAADRQEGDFLGYALELGVYTPGADAFVTASVRQVR